MLKNRPIWKIINEICTEENIKMKTLSYGYITELEKNGIKKRMVGNSLEINSANSYKIASDKYATYEMLKAYNIPTIKHHMVFNPETRSDFYNNEIERAKEVFFENNKIVILKSNDSSEGKFVFKIQDEKELEDTILNLFKEKKDTLSICPFYEIDYEYRAVFLDGEILFIYQKEKPYVIGNGNDTLEKLIENAEILEFYKELDLNYVPKKNERVEVSWKHNLSRGALPTIITDIKLKKELETLAIDAGKAVGVSFATVDIVHTKKEGLLVMEINSSVCMDKFSEKFENGYNIAKDVFKKAISKMFQND